MTLLQLDGQLGQAIYKAAQGNAVLKASAELVSMSGDEMLWVLIPSVTITAGFARRLLLAVVGAGLSGSSCAEEVLCDVFGTCCLGCFVEMLLKLAFRRARPFYAVNKAETYVIPGERFSLPSGHALRAAYLAFWLTHARHARLLLGALKLPEGALQLVPMLGWALLVSLARVAKGKHYPSDTLLGGAIGAVLGLALEASTLGGLSEAARGVVKTVCGVVITAAWGLYYFVPLLGPRLGMTLTRLLFFLFYIAMLLASVPRSAKGWSEGACGAK